MASTPPPPMRIHTPPTPLHGPRYDSWEPYSPRRSARNITKQSQVVAAAQPSASTPVKTHKRQRSVNFVTSTPQSKRATVTSAASFALSPPSSPETLSNHKTRSATQHAQQSIESSAPAEPISFLPTPRKTPRKQGGHLRTPSDSILTPSKRRARFTLDSPHDLEPTIEIFTDSQDRVPEMQPDEDNPFVGPRKIRSRSADYRAPPQTEEEAKMDAAVLRDEGLIYMFRGRKIFRPFSDTPTSAADGAQSSRIRRAAGSHIPSAIARSTLEPKLLFTSDPALPNIDVDEEADTDIDEPAFSSQGSVIRLDETAGSAPPPERSAKKGSPFDKWPRSKPGVKSGVKRCANDGQREGKRVRSH